MWPSSFPDWFHECEPEAVRIVYGRLIQYPVLSVFADRVSRSAVGRTREIGQYLRQYAAYFGHRYEFSRWLRVVSYREALRLILPLESVETALAQLDAEERKILRYRYIDQLSDDEVARMLDLRTSNRLLYDAAVARKCSLDAYLQLCRVLEKRYTPPATPKAGRHRDVSTLFPLFPGVYREDFRSSPKGGNE